MLALPKAMKPAVTAHAIWALVCTDFLTMGCTVLREMATVKTLMKQSTIILLQSAKPDSGINGISPM